METISRARGTSGTAFAQGWFQTMIPGREPRIRPHKWKPYAMTSHLTLRLDLATLAALKWLMAREMRTQAGLVRKLIWDAARAAGYEEKEEKK